MVFAEDNESVGGTIVNDCDLRAVHNPLESVLGKDAFNKWISAWLDYLSAAW